MNKQILTYILKQIKDIFIHVVIIKKNYLPIITYFLIYLLNNNNISKECLLWTFSVNILQDRYDTFLLLNIVKI